MNDNINVTVSAETAAAAETVTETAAPAELSAAEKDYQTDFMPRVHRIGRITMAIAFLLAFLPVLYFYFIRGYQLPLSNYFNVVVAIASIGIGLWLTEPLAYWPVLGSAGTYMSYLSGNVGGMRFPVALSVQSAMKADINTPRGQVITIIGIVASIFTNLVILLAIVLAGGWLLTVLPAPVMAAFAFVMPCLLGCMLIMRFASGKEGFLKTTLSCLPYLVSSVGCKLIITYLLPQLATYGTAISVGVTILVAYVLYRQRLAKAG